MSKVATKSSVQKLATIKKTPTVEEYRKREQERRIEAKCELLEKYQTSEELFDELRSNIDTLSQDESSHDLSVEDIYNFGLEYEIELLMEVISDLRFFTRYIKCDDDKHIKDFGLDYIRQYWND